MSLLQETIIGYDINSLANNSKTTDNEIGNL